MNRRQFIQVTGAVTLGSLMTQNTITGQSEINGKQVLKAIDLKNYLRSLYNVPEPSVDRIIIGNPETEITKIGTCWMPYWKTLKEAAAKGVNTMVVHEPTFYTHRDLDEKERDYHIAPEAGKAAYLRAVEKKKKWIEDNGMVIIRCHDVLDVLPDIGIPYGLARVLGFSEKNLVDSKKYYHVYKITPGPAKKVVKDIAARLKSLNQQGVEFYGDPEYTVSKVGLGTGCACDPLQYMEMGADLYIGIDDTIRTWIQTVYADDTGIPLVVINHGTSEEVGMRLLNEHLQNVMPHFQVLHFNQGCGYKWVTG